MTRAAGIRVREATAAERADVLNILDGNALATEIEQVTDAVTGNDALVAVTSDRATDSAVAQGSADERILGALVLDGNEIGAVAVRRRRRDQGIGTALVEAASQRRDRLVAAFRPGVRPFWDALGFDISRRSDTDRYRGVRYTDGQQPRYSFDCIAPVTVRPTRRSAARTGERRRIRHRRTPLPGTAPLR